MSIPSSTIIGGLSSSYARNHADFYPTPPECTWALLNRVRLVGPVWEPACGDGAISRVLEAAGFDVISTDLHDRGYGLDGCDFLKAAPPQRFGALVTNPPFNLAEDFIRRARSFGVPFAMLLKSTYWHAARRQRLFQETGPAKVLAMTWRPNFAPERGDAPTMDVCWTVWDAAPAGQCVFEPLAKPAQVEDIFA